MLSPEEIIQNYVAPVSKTEKLKLPALLLDVTYEEEKYDKLIKYMRKVSCQDNPNLKSEEETQLNAYIKSIMYSENRMANYFEGRTLYTFDEVNSESPSSLKQDIKKP